MSLFNVISLAFCAAVCWRFEAVSALSSGAPSLVCSSMTPHHFAFSARPSTSCPFTVQQSKLTYRHDNDTVVVKLTVKDGYPRRSFRGFLVKAINPLNQHAIGQFKREKNVNVRTSCHAATHVNADNKAEILLHWSPVNVDEEEDNLVVFEATFVETFRTFFVGIQSTYRGQLAIEAIKAKTGSLLDEINSKGTNIVQKPKTNIFVGNDIENADGIENGDGTKTMPKNDMNTFWF